MSFFYWSDIIDFKPGCMCPGNQNKCDTPAVAVVSCS